MSIDKSVISKAMSWLLNARTGKSSKCMMATILNGGLISGDDWNTRFHPLDPSDFKRCIGLLNHVPEFRSKINIMKDVSPCWAILVEHWDELESMINENSENAYEYMKSLLKNVKNGYTS